MLQALGFFALVEVVGLAAVPLAGLVFGRLPGAGLGFAKPLGLLLVTWLVWMAVSLGDRALRHARRWSVRPLVLAVAGALAAVRQRALAARRDDDRRRLVGAPPRRADRASARCRATTRSAGGCGWARRSCSRSPSR